MSNGFGKVGLNFGGRSGGNGLGQVVQIIKLPQALTNNAKTLRLEGEITQINKDSNTARIQTPQGEIDVKVKSKDVSQGQRLTVDIPAGRPPKQVRLSPEAIIRPPPQQSSPRATETLITTSVPNVPVRSDTTQPSLTQKVIQKISQKLGTVPHPQISDKRTEGQQISQQNQIVTKVSLEGDLAKQAQNLPQEVSKQLLAQAVKNIPNIPQALKIDDVVRLLNTSPAQAQEIAAQTAQKITVTQQQVTIISNLQSAPASNTAAITPSLTLNTSTVAPNVSQPINNLIPSSQTIAAYPLQTNATFSAALTPPTPSNNLASLQLTTLPQQQPITQVINTNQTLTPTQINSALQTIAGFTPPTQAVSNIINTTLQPIAYDPLNTNIVSVQKTPRIDVQIVKITPPMPIIASASIQNIPAATQFAPSFIGNISAPALTAQVTGFNAQGLPLVTAKLPGTTLPQSFIMQYRPNNLVLGSQLQIIPKAGSGLLPMTVQSQPLNPLLQGFQWPALDELYNGLLQISPQSAASLTRSLPNAGNPTQMGAAAMMFIAAVKSGDIGGFIGDRKIDLLKRIGKENLLPRLAQGDGGGRATPEAATSSDWRAVPLPMFWEGEIHRITLYTRHENQNQRDNQDNNKNGQTRFVFDLSLTRMGKVQLDGFLKDQRLDLIIRTQNAFSQPMQQTMRQAYSGALDQTSLSGDLSFQGSTENWVHVLENEKQFGANA